MSFILSEEAALKSYLMGMTVSDEGNSSRPVKVYFGTPDLEIGSQEYPFILVTLIDVMYASYRKHRGGRWTTTETHGAEATPLANQVMVRIHPEPYDLTFQITTYCRHPRHDRMLLGLMNHKLPGNNGVMPLLETYTDGDPTPVWRPLFVDEFRKRDSVDGSGNESRRLFRNFYTVRVPTELDPDEVTATYQVLYPKLNITTTHIPTGYDKP